MLQTASMIAENHKVLYISGEESAEQIKQRADRLQIKSKALEILCETSLENVLTVLEKGKYDFVVLDSIQTMTSAEIGNTPGTPNQLKYCCGMLTDWAKQYNKVVMMIAHVTKDGLIAGPKTIEHPRSRFPKLRPDRRTQRTASHGGTSCHRPQCRLKKHPMFPMSPCRNVVIS